MEAENEESSADAASGVAKGSLASESVGDGDDGENLTENTTVEDTEPARDSGEVEPCVDGSASVEETEDPTHINSTTDNDTENVNETNDLENNDVSLDDNLDDIATSKETVDASEDNVNDNVETPGPDTSSNPLEQDVSNQDEVTENNGETVEANGKEDNSAAFDAPNDFDEPQADDDDEGNCNIPLESTGDLSYSADDPEEAQDNQHLQSISDTELPVSEDEAADTSQARGLGGLGPGEIEPNQDNAGALSPATHSNSEISEREIQLEPFGADDSENPSHIGGVMPHANIAEPHGPSAEPWDDREDISDEEFNLDGSSAGSMDNTFGSVPLSGRMDPEYRADQTVPMREISLEQDDPSFRSFPNQNSSQGMESYPAVEGDGKETPSSDDKEIINLNLEDAGRGVIGNEDANRLSKAASEELEAVSDDEWPEAHHQAPANPAGPPMWAAPLIEGGEEVSSDDDDGPASPDPPDKSAFLNTSDVSEPPTLYMGEESSIPPPINMGSMEPSVNFSVAEPVSPTALSDLAPEPISDDEHDHNIQDHTEPVSPDPVSLDEPEMDPDGEAGEIKSPTEPINSPPSIEERGEETAILGEVEPISASEHEDTDGELPSGDEEAPSSKPTNFESIESDEEGEKPQRNRSSSSQLGANTNNADGAYMETISDDENLEGNDHKTHSTSAKTAKENSRTIQESNPFYRGSEHEKRSVAPNFYEHQVELDYEENEGEDGDGKVEESKTEFKAKKEEDGEIEGGSDKDEGEVSDDDCEEGEIKEPGTKKPFVMPVCRFFQRGHCTWGVTCRFLHPGVNDKGNYQMIEIPGFKPIGVKARIGGPGPWPEQPEEPLEPLPPPPLPDTPPPETAWERGLRIAKEQRKKAVERKEQEPDFEEKRLNLSVDEERELNKENERHPRFVPKDPYYDQQAFEEDEYYKVPREPWQTNYYDNFEVRYHQREHSFSPPYREKPPPQMPPSRYNRPYSPPVDKFGRDRERERPERPAPPPVVERQPEPFRPKQAPPAPAVVQPQYPPAPNKRPDEWTDPWRRQVKRSKTPPVKRKRSRSRGRGRRRSDSVSSNSSRSGSGSSSGSSRSSRSYSGSSGSSSRSRSPEPAPPGVDRHDRYGNQSPSRNEPPRSAVSVRESRGGGYQNYDQGYRRDYQGGYNPRGRGRGNYQEGNFRGGGRGQYNNYNNYNMDRGGGHFQGRDNHRGMMRGHRGRDDRMARNRGRPSSPGRPLPYDRPRPRSASSGSSSSRSRSRSRSRGRYSSSRSRSSSGSSRSRSSSSSSSSAGSADSEHLYRDLASPTKNARGPVVDKKKRRDSEKDRSRGMPKMPLPPGPPGSQKLPPLPPPGMDRNHPPREGGMPPLPPGRPESSKYASRNAPQMPVKAKDPLKVMGQKSNIKLTLLPKQQQQNLGNRPNPLDSPPHGKRRISERDSPPSSPPAAKRLSLPLPQASALRIATEKAAKLQIRQERGKSPPPISSLPPPSSMPPMTSSSSTSRAKVPVPPTKYPSSSLRSRGGAPPEPSMGKAAPKVPAPSAPPASASAAASSKPKKSMSSRREELLKQLKAVEDAIARKKSKLS